jgi:hypothetical protein
MYPVARFFIMMPPVCRNPRVDPVWISAVRQNRGHAAFFSVFSGIPDDETKINRFGINLEHP